MPPPLLILQREAIAGETIDGTTHQEHANAGNHQAEGTRWIDEEFHDAQHEYRQAETHQRSRAVSIRSL